MTTSPVRNASARRRTRHQGCTRAVSKLKGHQHRRSTRQHVHNQRVLSDLRSVLTTLRQQVPPRGSQRYPATPRVSDDERYARFAAATFFVPDLNTDSDASLDSLVPRIDPFVGLHAPLRSGVAPHWLNEYGSFVRAAFDRAPAV
mmetsp:Transcript_17855/g.43897  ORF Transcript_17855/g.43897 Transcript_17855/m.43897 type:complete len:145 (+) Transcript_17855:186-620(+)|eukprot:CAMPEP_0185188756 /NCGR_PEP_ID=MMETSP1140-20130426/5599_1 /TAXON_ID=298111 /ORGANISM="Pavlova sp., Strain CCMP459" /LENGTH=144 /DNA_ID=CAMNT_0027755271 /DNA_START=200 /DNA_END=634 /DNA_ORIENTATION=+